jgi:primary-amine oxidase
VHEEDAGLAWRHCDWRNDATDVRRGRRLVVSFFTTVANYDYGFRWQFYLDGTIKVDAELTGILSTVVTPPGEKSRYGTQVATNISGTFHQHFFCMRIDSQVDGLNNTVYEVHSEREPRGVGNPFLNAFTAKHKALKTEKEAQRENHPQSNRFWLIANDNKKNAYGDSPAYALVPFSEGVLPFAYDDSHLLQRAPFLRKHLWVTPFNQKEKYPGTPIIGFHNLLC